MVTKKFLSTQASRNHVYIIIQSGHKPFQTPLLLQSRHKLSVLWNNCSFLACPNPKNTVANNFIELKFPVQCYNSAAQLLKVSQYFCQKPPTRSLFKNLPLQGFVILPINYLLISDLIWKIHTLKQLKITRGILCCFHKSVVFTQKSHECAVEKELHYPKCFF